MFIPLPEEIQADADARAESLEIQAMEEAVQQAFCEHNDTGYEPDHNWASVLVCYECGQEIRSGRVR